MYRKLGIIVLIAAIAALLALPLATQAKTPDPSSITIVSGPVDLSGDSIMVNGYVIAPASAFSPSILQQGDEVIITGYLLDDGVTIQAISLEFWDDSQQAQATPEPTAEVTTEPTAEVTTEPTAEVTTEPTAEVTAEATAQLSDTGACTNPDQPVGQRLADAFGVSYDEIMSWRCQGFGFGEIARAYLLADASGKSADYYFAEKASGMGWGQILKDSKVKPSDLAPGRVIHHGQNDNTNGNGNGHGNNGNGHGNNGNGHGNNGNGHGNGHGNGG